MIAYVLPTRDRRATLDRTLAALGRLPPHGPVGGGMVVIVDNASSSPTRAPVRLPNDLDVHVVPRPVNEGCAARNAGAQFAARTAAVEWIVMLDDDSYPTDAGLFDALRDADETVGAISADIHLPEHGEGRRESGGLPEVFVGCGAAVRARAFLELGGYDPAFDYYAEEYDLSARLLMTGLRVVFDPRFRVHHHKVAANRSMGRILRRLVRNNAWVMARYAPADRRADEIRRLVLRYGRIATLERALGGFVAGACEAALTLGRQRRTPMGADLFDRFTGLAHARAALGRARELAHFSSACIVRRGKNDHLIERALRELGVAIVGDEREAEVRVIGTLSPGPMLDAREELEAFDAGSPDPVGSRVLLPWLGARGPKATRAACTHPVMARVDRSPARGTAA
ncbi:MAG: glycosyltransferase family 2 protein [Phycisphaerae bacterium]|nr:glycosyltransferase family 2 protein [Phycisphaerae bacterium]